MGWRDQSKYYTGSKPENAVAKPSSSNKPAQTQSASAVTPQAQQTPAASHANDSFWQRAVNTVQGGLRDWWSGKAAAVGQALDFGNWLNGKSSVADRAIADSDYAGWVTDPLAEATFKEQWQKGNLRSAGILKENKETARKVNAYADTVSEKGQKDIAEAQEGLGFVGRTLVGAGSSAVEMGLDFASSYLLGAVGGGMSAAGSGGRAVLNSARSGATALTSGTAGKATLASMATRVYGSAAQEARRNGATAAQAQTVGLMSAATEVFSESIFGGFGRVYGKGFADGIGNRVAMNLAKSPAGYRILKTIFAGVEEGSEEIVSQVMEPFAKAIYAGHGSYLDRVGQAYDEQEAMDYVSSFATGALLGLLGEGRAELSRGGRANSNNTYNAMTELEKAGVNTREMTEEQIQMAYALKEAGTDVNSLKAKDQIAPWGRIEEAYEALTPEQKSVTPGGQTTNPEPQAQSPVTEDNAEAGVDLNEPASIPNSAADLARSATHNFQLARAAQVAANNATDDAQREAFMQKVYEYNAAYEAQQAVNLVVNSLQPTDEALSNLVGNDRAMDLYQGLTGDLTVPRGKGQRGVAIDHIMAFLGNRAAAANRVSQQKPAGAPQSNADSRVTNNPTEAAANSTAQSQQFNSKPERISNVTGEPMNEYEARFWDEIDEADEPLRSEEPGATMRAQEEAAAQAAPETTEGGKDNGEERVPVQDAGRDGGEDETGSAGRAGVVRGSTPAGENDSGRVREAQSEKGGVFQENGNPVSESSSDVRYGISEAVKKRANRARSIIEKFGKDAYTAVSREAVRLLTASGDARLMKTLDICAANNISEEVTNKSLYDLSVSDAIENAADGDPRILREALLSVTGEERVDDVIDMLLEGEERVRAKFTETEDSKGNKAVNVETPGKNATLPAGTRTVFFNSNKYRRQSNDVVVMRNLRGRIVKRGSAEEYYVVDWANNVWGAKFDSLGAAKSILNRKANTFLMTTFYLNGQEMVYEGRRLRVKNDQPFLDRSRLTVHNTSQAAEDLGVEFASYRRSPLTKSMAEMDFGLILDGDEGRSGTDNAKFDRSKRLEHFLRMGFYTADGTHWVFVGQTANQRKNNKCLVMPEQEYAKLRKRMCGGFDPDTISKFNPAKYLTNQGFYFTPSNADTGIKMDEVIVGGDIYKQMGTTVRRRLVTSNGEASESEKIVGQAYMVFGDLICNMTDGTGFVWDPKLGDKTKSMQFRAIGGFKGFAAAYNWVQQLQDVIPEGVEYAWLGEDGKVAGGMRKVNGKVEILDKWGTWQTIEGKKMLLFDSCVKFADFYESSDDFYDKLKGVDVRSIPRENVYGSREGGGMLSEHHRAGLRQLLRTQPAPTAEIFKEIIDENITDPIAYILEDKKRLGKVLGVDFDSKTPPVGGDTPAYLAYYFGPDFFDTMLGQYFLRSKIQSVLDDFRGGKLYFQDEKENYQWLGEDPAGVFNAMTSLVFQHTQSKLEEVKKSGAKVADEHHKLTDTRFQESKKPLIDTFLEKGEIQNFNLEGVKFDENGNLVDGSGDTLIGRFPNAEMSDLQIRRNARNAAYEAMMEKYGADKDVTWLSLNDALTLFLDSDFDGDTGLAAQGAIVKAIKKIREEMGGKIQGEYNPADIFTEIAHGKAEKQMVQDVDTLIAAISAGMKAEDEENIGKFDTGIEYMSAFSDEELRGAVDRYNEAHPTAKITGDVHEQARKYRSYVTALFAAAYKLNIDYAKTMWYPPEFKSVVDSYLNEISVIAKENGYYVDGGKKAVPASWEFAGSNKQKRFKDVQWAERDWDTKKQGKKPKFFIRGGPSILDAMYNTDNEALAKQLPKDIAAYFQAYDEFRNWMDDKGFGGIDLSVLSTVDRMQLNQLFSSEDGKALRNALVDAWDAIMKSRGPENNTEGNAYREKMLYELYKAAGVDNDQFTSAMLYVLSTKGDRVGWKTLFNFDPKTHDRFSKEDSSSDILSRNARILANLKYLENTLPEARAAIVDAQKKLDDFQRAADANDEQRIRREFGIRVNMSAEIERLNGIIKDLTHRLSVMEHAIQNYGNSVKDIKTLEEALANSQAYHEYADRMAQIKQQLIEAQKELHAAEDISEAAKRRMDAIYGRYDEQIQKVDAVLGRLTDALDAAHEDYARIKAAAEDAYSAKEYYGIGVDQRTGFEEKDLSSLTDEIEALTEDFKNRYASFDSGNSAFEQKAGKKLSKTREKAPAPSDNDAPPMRYGNRNMERANGIQGEANVAEQSSKQAEKPASKPARNIEHELRQARESAIEGENKKPGIGFDYSKFSFKPESAEEQADRDKIGEILSLIDDDSLGMYVEAMKRKTGASQAQIIKELRNAVVSDYFGTHPSDPETIRAKYYRQIGYVYETVVSELNAEAKARNKAKREKLLNELRGVTKNNAGTQKDSEAISDDSSDVPFYDIEDEAGGDETEAPPHTDKEAPPQSGNEPPRQEGKQEQKAEPEQPQKPAPAAAPAKNQKAYGEAYGRVNDAANGINTAIGKGAKTAVPDSAQDFLGERFGDYRAALSSFGKALLNAFYTDDGGKSLVDFASNLRNTITDSDALKFVFGDPKKSNIMRTADLLRKADEGQQFEAASAAFMEEIQKEIETLPQSLEILDAFKKNTEKLLSKSKFLKYISGTKPGAALVSMYVGWQRDTIDILQGLDGFDKYANGFGYKLAQSIKDRVYEALKVSGNAKAAVLAAQKAFNKDPVSRKTIAIELFRNGEKEQHTIEMADAIDLLHIFDTIADSKLNPNDDMYYGLGNGDVLHLGQPEHYIAVRNAIEKAVNGNKAAKAYYDVLSESYDAYAHPVQNAVKAATGRNMRLYRKGHYYPISISVGKGNNTSGRDGSFGLDNLGFTQERTKIKGGYIKVYDPAQRFASYDMQASMLIGAAEAGATMERLSRSGAGDNLLTIIRKTWGQGAVDTVEQFIKDASNFRTEEDASANIFRKLRLNLQKGALFGNAGSMLKQYPSVFNAVGVLDMDAILHGIGMMTKAENRARAAAQGAIKTRHQGNLDSTIAEVLKPEAKSRMQKVLNAIGGGFEYIDSKAIQTIWLASEYQAEKDGLAPAMQEELFKEAFLQTQPQFNKLLRPYVQTSDKEWVRLFGMFKTQPLRNLNTMIRAINEYKAANAEHKAKAAAALRKTISGQVVSSVMFGALGVAAKLLYHRRKDLEDENGNLDGTKVIARIAFNSIEASSGMLIFGDTLAQWIIDKATKDTDVETNDYYGVSAGWVSTVIDTFSSFNDFIDKPTMYGFKKLAGNLATDFGIPLNNAYAIVNSLVMYAKDINGTNTMRYNDMLQLADKYRKMKPKELVAVTIDEALLQLRRGNSARATAMMQTLSTDQAEDIKKYLTKTFASGNMTRTLLEKYLKTYAGLDGDDLEKAMKAADLEAAYFKATSANPDGVKAVKAQIDAVKTVEGGEPRAMQVADIIMSSSLTDSQKQAMMGKFLSESYLKGFNALTAAGYSSKEAVDLIDSINSDDQATLTQKELFRYFLEHPDDRKGIEAIWNVLHTDDTITETYADTGIKNAFYEDRMTEEESVNWLVRNAGYTQEEAEKKVESWAGGKDFWLASQANEEAFGALAEEISDLKRDMGRRGENATFAVANAVLDSDLTETEKGLAIDHYMSDKFLGVFYGLRDAGYSGKDAVAAYQNVMNVADGLVDGKKNGSLTQKEMLAAYRQDRSLGSVLEVIWNANGYKKTWDDVT